MSVSDPLIKQLKGFILTLRSQDEPVTDSSQLLQQLCSTLEQILAKGLRANTSWFGKSVFWRWVSKLESVPLNTRVGPQLSMAILFVKKTKKTKTDVGRGRLFLRAALVKKSLAQLVKLIVDNPQVAEQYYIEKGSILGDEILREILFSLLLELKEVDFKLQIQNSSFLDISWEMPIFKQYEFVPSLDLGLDIRTVKGYPLVTQVDEKCVAAEDLKCVVLYKCKQCRPRSDAMSETWQLIWVFIGKIEVGDVLDEMCGECLRDVGKSGCYYIFNHHEGQPIQISVIKNQTEAGTTYGPIAQLLKSVNLGDLSPGSPSGSSDGSPWVDYDEKPPPEAILPEEMEDEIPVHDSEGKATYVTTYLGKSFLGKDGRVNMVEQGVHEVMQRCKNKRAVILELGEKEVKVLDQETKETLIHHLFTEISACGRRTDELLNFAFIAGETYCSMADQFYCHVFEARSEEEAKIILCTIAQGFDRTHLMT